MNKKELLDLGVAENLVDQLIIINGKDIENVKAKVDPLQTANDNLQAQLEEANKTIDSFKAMDIDTIKKTAEDYKTAAEQAKEEAELQLYEMQFNHALDLTLREVGARNSKAVSALLDLEKLDLDEEGNITGLEDQLVKVAEENPYLFEPSEDNPELITGARSHSVIGDATVMAARKAANLPVTKE